MAEKFWLVVCKHHFEGSYHVPPSQAWSGVLAGLSRGKWADIFPGHTSQSFSPPTIPG